MGKCVVFQKLVDWTYDDTLVQAVLPNVMKTYPLWFSLFLSVPSLFLFLFLLLLLSLPHQTLDVITAIWTLNVPIYGHIKWMARDCPVH